MKSVSIHRDSAVLAPLSRLAVICNLRTEFISEYSVRAPTKKHAEKSACFFVLSAHKESKNPS